jgi:hypothetical protein
VSHLCHISPVAPPSHIFPPRPSCRIRPVSGGHNRICSSPRRRRRRPAVPRPPPGGRSKPQSPGAHRLSQRVPRKVTGDHVPTETRISNMSRNISKPKSVSTGLGSQSCAPITTSSIFKPIPSQVSAFFVDLLQALGVHLQQASDSSDVAFFRSLQDVSASKPKLWMSGVQGLFLIVDQS